MTRQPQPTHRNSATLKSSHSFKVFHHTATSSEIWSRQQRQQKRGWFHFKGARGGLNRLAFICHQTFKSYSPTLLFQHFHPSLLLLLNEKRVLKTNSQKQNQNPKLTIRNTFNLLLFLMPDLFFLFLTFFFHFFRCFHLN